MDLTLTDTQEQLLGEIGAFVRDKAPLQRLHGDRVGERALLREMGDMGWIGMSLPEEFGGAGFQLVDEALMLREVGRTLGPVSVLGGALAARIALHAGARCPAPILRGEASVAIAVPMQPIDLNARKPSGLVRLFGDGASDFAVLIDARASVLVALDGATLAPLSCLDGTVTMTQADFGDGEIVHRAEGQATQNAAFLLCAAGSTGAAQGARDLIAEYAKVRHTFGRPIGAYQAVRHPIADMAARCEQANTETLFAALALEGGRGDARAHALSARILAQQAHAKNADGAIQLHGGIGVTDEHDAHFFMKRANVTAHWFGGLRPLFADVLRQPLLGISGA